MPTPLYPQNQTVPAGQTAPTLRPWTNFLPTDPKQMSTGLTPQMMQSIGAIPQPTPQAPTTPAGGGGSNYSQMLDFFRQMMGGGGGGGGGMGGGAGLPPAGNPGLAARAAQVRLNPHYQSSGPSMQQQGPQFFPIPRPTPGAGGLISPADMAAYSSAQTQQQRQRDQLANEMNRHTIRNRYRPGGSR